LTLFDRIALEILSVYGDLCVSVRLGMIGCKVLAGFVMENVDQQSFEVVSLATGREFLYLICYSVNFREKR
jgi:hypothetical protein